MLILTGCGNKSEPIGPDLDDSDQNIASSNHEFLGDFRSLSESELKYGRSVFRKCQSCHTLDEGERHRVGPNLYGFYGKTAAQKENFVYSKALRQSDIIWTDAALHQYLERPAKFVPGNRMSFVGLRHEKDRQAVIAYIKYKTQKTQVNQFRVDQSEAGQPENE